MGACRTAPPRRNPGAALAGVPPEPAAGLPVQLVLRKLPSLAEQAGRGDASGAPRRREAIRRLSWPDGAGDRPP